jgi:hypothetical protein
MGTQAGARQRLPPRRMLTILSLTGERGSAMAVLTVGCRKMLMPENA